MKLPNAKTLHFAASVHKEHINLMFCHAQISVEVELCIMNKGDSHVSEYGK